MPAPLVGRGEDDVRVARVEHDVADARVLADRQDRTPGGPAVGRLVESALAALGKERPLRRHVHDVRVAGVDDDVADVLRGLEAHALPGLARVGRLVDAVAEMGASLAVVLARAEPEDVRILGVDGHAAEGEDAVVVEDRREGDAAIRRLPQAPERRHDVPDTRVLRVDLDVDDAAGGEGRTDAPKLESFEEVGRQAVLGLAGAWPGRYQTYGHQNQQGPARHVINSGRWSKGWEEHISEWWQQHRGRFRGQWRPHNWSRPWSGRWSRGWSGVWKRQHGRRVLAHRPRLTTAYPLL